ncbi:MAG: hypothetical protein U1F46_03135 [Marinagarivorans sp.]
MKKSSAQKKSSAKRQFSASFKQQAVERADNGRVAQVPKDLDITPGLIYNWGHSPANRRSEQKEIRLTPP